MRKRLNDEERWMLETILAFIMYKDAIEAGLMSHFMKDEILSCRIDCDTNISERGYIIPKINVGVLLSGTSKRLGELGFYDVERIEDILDNKVFKCLGLSVKDFYKLYCKWSKKLIEAGREMERREAGKIETLPITSDIACASKEESSSHNPLPYGKKKEELLKKLISSMQEVLDL